MRTTLLATLTVVTLAVTRSTTAQVVIDFDGLPLAADSAVTGDAAAEPLMIEDVSFNRTWNSEFNCCPGGWAYSNQTDLTTAGFTNSYSAYHAPTAGGANGSPNYGIANPFAADAATITLPQSSTVQGMYVTNTTYALLAVRDGNDGNTPAFVEPFSDGDWYRLDITAADADGNALGTLPFHLADYRNGQTSVVSEWTWVDLSGLGDQVSTLSFEMASSDTDPVFGMNTPAYFAMDELTFTPVPAPTSFVLLMTSLGVLLLAGRRMRRHDNV